MPPSGGASGSTAMFDIGFSELLVIGVVALIVIGPERLPKVARTAGVVFGRFQRYVANVKSDIQRELDASEISRLKNEVQDAARSFEQSVNQQVQAVDSGAKELEQSLKTAAEPVAAPADAATEAAFESAGLPEASAAAEPAAPGGSGTGAEGAGAAPAVREPVIAATPEAGAQASRSVP